MWAFFARKDARQLTELALLLTLGVIAIAVMAAAVGYREGARLYPFAVATTILILSTLRALQVLSSQLTNNTQVEADDETPREDMPFGSMALYALLIAGFVATLYLVSFPISAAIFGTLALRWVFGMSWTGAIASAIAISAATSGIFTLLDVPLPGPNV